MSAYINALVTFGTQGQRNTAQNAIQQWIADWNTANPTTPMTGTTTAITYTYPADDDTHPGVNARALQINYTCSTYDAITAVRDTIATAVNASSYWDVISNGIWWNP